MTSHDPYEDYAAQVGEPVTVESLEVGHRALDHQLRENMLRDREGHGWRRHEHVRTLALDAQPDVDGPDPDYPDSPDHGRHEPCTHWWSDRNRDREAG